MFIIFKEWERFLALKKNFEIRKCSVWVSLYSRELVEVIAVMNFAVFAIS